MPLLSAEVRRCVGCLCFGRLCHPHPFTFRHTLLLRVSPLARYGPEGLILLSITDNIRRAIKVLMI